MLVPWHGHYGAMAGGRRFTLGMSLSDVLRARQPALSRRLGDEISEAIEAQRFGAIVVDNTGGFFGGVFDDALRRCYEPQAPLFVRDDVFWPVTGFHTRPEVVWVPRPAPGCRDP